MSISSDTTHAALDAALALGELGIQVAAYRDGELVVDAWAGTADPDGERAVDGETLFPIFSVTKAVTATALHVQAERGLVDYHEPVATYWPEYAANGKSATTVLDVLTHRSGAPQMPEDVTTELLADWDWMIARLAEQPPIYAPGTTNAYHSISWGWLVGEIVRRTDPANRSFAAFVREEICEPLGVVDLYLGVPAGAHARVATLVDEMAPSPNEAPLRALTMPAAAAANAAVFGRPDVWSSAIPGAGGVASARAVARLFAMLAGGGELDGVRLLSEERVRSFLTPRDGAADLDQVSRMIRPVGIGGYWIAGDDPVVGGGHVLWHPGAGGSTAWADLDARIAVAICHNRMFNADAIAPDQHPFVALARSVRS